MIPSADGRFPTVFCLLLALAVPSFSAPPGFFESLRNEPDTEPTRADTQPTGSDTDAREPEPTPSPSLRKSDSHPRDPKSEPDTQPPRPELRSPGETTPSVRVVIPPSNSTLGSGGTASDYPGEPRTAPSRKERHTDGKKDTGVRFSRSGRSFDDRFFVGMRWPGVSVGLRESPYTLEVKHLEESDDVKITGVRLYHHLLRVDDSNVYWGVDLSRISFEGQVSEGTGNSTGVYAGFEKRLWNRFSWSVDMGPYYIHLRDDATNITADGLEFTLTTGLNVGFL